MRPSSPLRSPNDVALRKVIEDKTKIEGDMIQMRSQVRSLRNEKEAAEEEVSGKFYFIIHTVKLIEFVFTLCACHPLCV